MPSGISDLFGSSKEGLNSLFSKASKVDSEALVSEKKRHVVRVPRRRKPKEDKKEEEEEEDEEGEEETEEAEPETESHRKKHENDDEDSSLEDRYMKKLIADQPESKEEEEEKEEEGEEEKKAKEKSEDAPEAKPINLKSEELDKAERTVFVGNVPAEVMSDKKSTNKFKKVFSEFVKVDPEEKGSTVESIRFRSIHTKSSAPRKAAYIHGEFEEGSTVNSYVVFKKAEDSLRAIRLNGGVYLGHHLRVDHLAHPAGNDTRSSVFVGNLDFGEKEESLWKYFGEKLRDDDNEEEKVVQNVRIVRDPKTNYGKGFAIVQFTDVNYVEKALLLNGKKLTSSKKPRELRISRCKAQRKQEGHNDRRTHRTREYFDRTLNDKQRTMVGRARKVLGKRDRYEAGMPVLEGARARKGERIEGMNGRKKKKHANRK